MGVGMRDTSRLVPRLISCVPAVFAVLVGAPARADTCSAETAQLTAIARGVEVKIEAPKGNMADAPAHISWRATVRAPIKVPVFIAVAIPGEVRFRVPPLPPKPQTTGN